MAPSSSSAKKPAAKSGGYQQRDNSGSLFYDAPGAPTVKGSITVDGKTFNITGEPANDKNNNEYLKLAGDGMSGALYANDKITGETSPEFRGPAKFDGTEKRIAAWKKQTKSGQNPGSEFLSIAVSDPLPPRE